MPVTSTGLFITAVIKVIFAITAALLVSGCDTLYGVARTAPVHAVPDMTMLKQALEAYPEISEVKFSTAEGGRPLTLTGIHKPDEVFYLNYRGGQNVHGNVWFVRNYKGEVEYHQSLAELNRHPPQTWIDATWPVMKKIENDLETRFGLSEIKSKLQIWIHGVEAPDRPEVVAGTGRDPNSRIRQ